MTAKLLVEHGVSGVPVIDAGRVIGVLSESDILPLHEERPARPVRTAADVMTAPVITLTEEATVTEAARVLERHRVKRAPVLRGGVLVGIITRGDLLRPYLRTDSEILALRRGHHRRPGTLSPTRPGGGQRRGGHAHWPGWDKARRSSHASAGPVDRRCGRCSRPAVRRSVEPPSSRPRARPRARGLLHFYVSPQRLGAIQSLESRPNRVVRPMAPASLRAILYARR
jgi:CBS domain containing-hemolysin-like protein